MSYTALLSQPPSNSSNATFRAWGQMIANTFISANWTRATDTGNIDWTAVATTATATTFQGWDIFKMGDTLQTTAPVYVKIEYGCSATAGAPGIAITIGSGSNGSGYLTGLLSTRQVLGCGGNSTSNIISVVSGDTNRIAIGLWGCSVNATQNVIAAVTTFATFFSIERTKDATGNDTSEGVLLLGAHDSGGITKYQQYWNCTSGPTGQETGGWAALMPTPNVVQSSAGLSIGGGVQAPVYPIYHSKGVFLNPGLNALCMANGWCQELSTVVIPMYGANHTYMPFTTVTFNSTVARHGANSTFMMRYE